MSFIETVKWLWDPRTEEEKMCEDGPFRRYTQEFLIFIKGIASPHIHQYIVQDMECGPIDIRVDINHNIQKWLENRANLGVRVKDTWYPPEQIERIEIGKQTVEII